MNGSPQKMRTSNEIKHGNPKINSLRVHITGAGIIMNMGRDVIKLEKMRIQSTTFRI